MERDATISAIVERHFNLDSLSVLKDGLSFPVSSKALSEHLLPVYRGEDVLPDMTQAMMEDMRRNGLVEMCPNNGPRGVRSMSAWNSWISDPKGKGERPFWYRSGLASAPAFDAPRDSFSSAMRGVVRALQKAAIPEGKIDHANPVDVEISEADFDAGIEAMIEDLKDTYLGKTRMRISIVDAHCNLTGDRVGFGDYPLTPVLTGLDASFRHVVLPAIEEPRVARHMTIELPSHELVMADWFRVPGFKEGLETLVGGDDYDINNAAGLDERMHDYLFKAGIAIVQVGNTSPSAYAERPGLWRMGHVDDDHDVFWTEEDTPTDVAVPEPSWSTCTDLWANVMGDPKVIVDIMMVSGQHEDRAAAEAVLDAYIEETYGANRIPMEGIDRLHIYAPTGYAVNTGDFPERFIAQEAPHRDWQDDSYLLSADPLSVDPELVEPEIWCGPETVGPPVDADFDPGL